MRGLILFKLIKFIIIPNCKSREKIMINAVCVHTANSFYPLSVQSLTADDDKRTEMSQVLLTRINSFKIMI